MSYTRKQKQRYNGSRNLLCFMHLTSRLWYLLGHNHGDIIIKYIPFPVLLGGMDAGEREQAAGLLGSVV